ncbi:cellulase family glycosylhydrolase [Lichenicola cladoniae]|nr:cellulase family glycosylhydrolase [Lichenicola cladoniae]
MALFNRRSVMALTAAGLVAGRIKNVLAQDVDEAVLSTDSSSTVAGRWSAARAKAWHKQQPWRVGPVYVTSTAVNQLEMWQAATFDPVTIDRELGWAQTIGMNTVRVFLHDALYAEDPDGLLLRMRHFLTIAASHNISTFFVLFDSCWRGLYVLGTQPAPLPGIHNSQWVQSPGAVALSRPSQYPRLKAYVQGVVSAFANDPRVLFWDLWNEADNTGSNDPTNKQALVASLLPQVYAWARAVEPSQPLTSCLWKGDWSTPSNFNAVQAVIMANNDINTFHNYGTVEVFSQAITWMKQYGRPVLCTEYMARNIGCLFDTTLPVARKHSVAAINWGFVVGKTQTNLPWDSAQHPYVDASAYGGTAWQATVLPSGATPVAPYALELPPIWQHEVLQADGTPYRAYEVQMIYDLSTGETGKG